MTHTHPRQDIQGKIDLLPTIQEKETVQLPLCMNSHFCTELEHECHTHRFPTCKHFGKQNFIIYSLIGLFTHSFN